MKHFNKIFAVLLAAVAVIASCQKGPQSLAPVENLKAYPGILTCDLTFTAPAQAVKAKVFYGSGNFYEYELNPLVEEQRLTVAPLPEGQYILRVIVIDEKGNISDPKGVKVKVVDPDDFAKQAWVVTTNCAEGFDVANLTDDDVNTTWRAEDNALPKTILIDITAPKPITKVILNSPELEGGSYPTAVTVEISKDGAAYDKVAEATIDPNPYMQEIEFEEKEGRYVKLTLTGKSSETPVQICEIDLANKIRKSGDNGMKMGELKNAHAPFELTGVDLGLGGRMSQVTGWIHSSETLVSHDSAVDNAMVMWSSVPNLVPDVTNGKVYQNLGLLAGKYRFQVTTDHSGRPFTVTAFFTAAAGDTLPDINKLIDGTADVLGVTEYDHDGNYHVYNVDFTLDKTGMVTLGYVYNTVTPDDQWPWCELYIQSFSITPLTD